MTVITRFAPSPTGFLHIGGARTALFNWLFAKAHGGKFLLRIENTDKERSTQAAIDAILESMEWLGLTWDEDIMYQSARQARHQEVARQLVEAGKAYYCYTSTEELTAMREQAQAEHKTFRYPHIWRDHDPNDAPKDTPPVIRLKAPLTGDIDIHDAVQGKVTVNCEQLDDLVLMRSDGTPTYMLAVVVDDHDMGVTHIIRGDDHLNNTFKQSLIYEAMGWETPLFTHVPLIHGEDGAKLSKRHGALGAEHYRDMGYLPEAMRNYLLRLGWSHGDDEIISTEQAIQWFNLEHIGKSPSRFDITKLQFINSHYLKEAAPESLIAPLASHLNAPLDDTLTQRLIRAMPSLTERAKTLLELAEEAQFYIARLPYDEKAEKKRSEGTEIIEILCAKLHQLSEWNTDSIHELITDYAEQEELKIGKVMPPLRVALTGGMRSAGSVAEIAFALGKEETIARLTSA